MCATNGVFGTLQLIGDLICLRDSILEVEDPKYDNLTLFYPLLPANRPMLKLCPPHASISILARSDVSPYLTVSHPNPQRIVHEVALYFAGGFGEEFKVIAGMSSYMSSMPDASPFSEKITYEVFTLLSENWPKLVEDAKHCCLYGVRLPASLCNADGALLEKLSRLDQFRKIKQTQSMDPFYSGTRFYCLLS